jgi:hypothetical protein
MGPGSRRRSAVSRPAGAPPGPTTPSSGPCMPPPPTRLAWPPNAPGRWNAPGWCWRTATSSWARWARSNSPWSPSCRARLAGLVATIDGLSPVGAAQMLAETGDPTRFDTAWALVKHAGLCPRDTASGTAPAPSGSPGVADPGCAWPPGRRPGARCPTTRSFAPATSS